MDRKQEIQNQIAELQRELAGMADEIEIRISTEDGWASRIMTRSLNDDHIIDALHENAPLKSLGGDDVTVECAILGYKKVFHVTENVSYNITPF